MQVYTTKGGICARQIIFDVDKDNTVHNVKFIGGCIGNHQGIAKLVEGMDIDRVITLLDGIICRGNSSCPDQLSKALAEYKKKV